MLHEHTLHWFLAAYIAGACLMSTGCGDSKVGAVTGSAGDAGSMVTHADDGGFHPDASHAIGDVPDAGPGADASSGDTSVNPAPEAAFPDPDASGSTSIPAEAALAEDATAMGGGEGGPLDVDAGRGPAEGGNGDGGTYVTCLPGQGHSHNLNNDNWAGTLTLFISYSSDTRSQTVDKGFSPAQWNAAVNSFNVPMFADQVASTGARNILLMLGQNTGYYCAPNSAYEQYAGVAAHTRGSVRDLPMEIADALAAKGIGMYLYLPEDVGWGDAAAANHFGLSSMAVGNWIVDANFTPKWNAVIKEWADRYGSKVKGWFFDGYESRWGVTAAMANAYRATCLAANPCAVVTFNGSGSDRVSDTQRGETRINASTGLPAKGLPTSRWDSSGLQVMWDFPLQAAWGQEIADNSPAIYTNANLKTFVTAAVKAQAVFALDVRTSLSGSLSTPIYDQLLAIKP